LKPVGVVINSAGVSLVAFTPKGGCPLKRGREPALRLHIEL